MDISDGRVVSNFIIQAIRKEPITVKIIEFYSKLGNYFSLSVMQKLLGCFVGQFLKNEIRISMILSEFRLKKSKK